MPRLLVIDDETNIQYSFKRVFENSDVEVVTAGTAAEGLEQFREHHPDVVLLDLQLPDRSGLEVFHEIHAEEPRRPVVFITAHGTTDMAIETMKSGAFDYLIKPVEVEKLEQTVSRAMEAVRLMDVPAVMETENLADRIVGRSPVMQEMCKDIGRIAPQDVNVLVRGESGTGKELVARALYQHSRRANAPFLAINCAAIPDTLLESELFGHEQGAFTGAVRRRIGKLEQCQGGTVFLDEIGDMPLSLQAKILRVLQEGEFQRVGGNQTLESQVRILAATNQNLEKLVADGRFRQDLYYRLNVVALRVPPLRERLEDVPELAHYFLFRFNQQLHLDLRGFAPETLEILQNYTWPGNVRELQSAIKQAMLKGSGQTILPQFLPDLNAPTLQEDPVLQNHESASTFSDKLGFAQVIDNLLQAGEKDLHTKILNAVEKELFLRVLRHTGGHQSQASELLGLNRATLRYKLKALGLAIDKIVHSSQESPATEAASP